MNNYKSQIVVIQSILSDICAALIISLITLKTFSNLLYYLLVILLVFTLAVKFNQIVEQL